ALNQLAWVGGDVGGASRADDPCGPGREQTQDQEDPLHGPTGFWLGSQSMVPPWVSCSSLRPRSLAPGQRFRFFSESRLARALASTCWHGLEPPGMARMLAMSLQGTPAEGAPRGKGLPVNSIRPMPPKASGS